MERQLAYDWLLKNDRFVFYNLKFGPGELEQFFAVYNAITGEAKTRSTCGRCLINMRHRLQTELKKLKLMKQYSVYRTRAGNLTLKEPKDNTVVFTIHATTDAGAKEALANLKAIEKREDKKIDQQ